MRQQDGEPSTSIPDPRTGLITVCCSSESSSKQSKIYLSRNPIIADYILMMRDENCPATQFRYNVSELAHLLAYEASGLLDLKRKEITLKLESGHPAAATMTDSSEVSVVAPTRSGLVLAAAVQRYFPHAPEGHVVLARRPGGGAPEILHSRLPRRLTKQVFFVDSTIVTGATALQLVGAMVAKHGATPHGCFVCIACTIEGAKNFFARFPNIPIVTGSISDQIDKETNQMTPGFGEIGDRLYNTDYDLELHRDM